MLMESIRLLRRGDLLNDSWYNTGYNMELSSSILKDYGNDETVIEVPKTVMEENDDGTYSVTPTSETIPFKMNADNLRGDGEYENKEGLDALVIKPTSSTDVQTYTIDLVQKPSDKLYMLYWTAKNVVPLGVKQVIEYTDGTTDSFKYFPLEMGLDTKKNTCEYYEGRYGWWLQRVLETYEDESGNLRAGTNATCGMALDMYALPLNTAKTPKSITFYCYPSEDIETGLLQVLYGLTQSAVSNEEMQDFITGLSADEVTYSNAQDIIKANKFADELISRNAAAESDFSAIRALLPAAESVKDYDLETLDISQYYTADTIGKLGESVTLDSTWKFHDNQIPGEYFQSLLTSLDELRVVSDNESYSFEQTGTKIPFYVDPDVTSTGIKDTIYINNGENISIDASAIGADNFADSVYILAYGKPTLSVDVTYEDGTVQNNTYKLTTARFAGEELANTPAFAGLWTSDSGVNLLGSRVISNSDSSLETVVFKDGVPMATVFKLALDPGKKVQNIYMSATGADLYIYAMTQNVMSNAKMDVYTSETNSITEVTEENVNQVMTANAYADEMILRNAASEDDFIKLRELKEDAEYILSAEDPAERFVPLDYDVDMFVKEGDRLNESFYFTGRNVDESNLVDSQNIWKINKAQVIDGEKVVSDETVSFKMNTNAFRGDGEFTDGSGKDGILVENGEKTVQLSGKAAKELYVNIYSAAGKTSNVTINYKDGTSVPLSFALYGCDGDTIQNITASEYYAGSTSNRWPNRYTNENGIATYWSAVTMSYVMYSLPVDSEKQIDSITFQALPNEYYIVFALTEIPVSNAEMKDYINNLNIQTVTAENFERVLTANAYADELVERHSARESEFETLRALREDAEFYSQMENPTEYTWDITSYFNVDTIAVAGDALDDTFVELGDQNNLCGNIVASQLQNGVKIVDEMRVVENAGDEQNPYVFENTGVQIPFAMSTDSLNGKILDAIEIDQGDVLAIDALAAQAAERVDTMYMLIYPNSYGTIAMRVNYADGTWEDKNIDVRKSRIASEVANYPAYAGYWYIGGYLKIQNNNGVAEQIPGEPHLNYYKIDIDPSKKIDSIRMSYTASWGSTQMYLYAITTMPMSNEELFSGIEQARDLVALDDYGLAGYVTEENVKIAENAAQYVYELEERKAAMSKDYADIFEIAEQATAQLPQMIDISDKFDSDIIVTAGDTQKATKDTGIYESSKIPETGVVELSPAGDGQYDNGEAGRTFMISGTRSGENDSAALNRVGTTFEIGDKILKKIAFAIDSEVVSTIKVTVNYTDNTSETLLAPVYDRDFWSTSQINPYFAVSQAQWNTETGAYEATTTNNFIVSSVIEPTQMKKISSVTVSKEIDSDVYMLAMTVVPYTNDELIGMWDAMEIELAESHEQITEDNAQAVYQGAVAALEMNDRHYPLTQGDIERIVSLKSSAEDIIFGRMIVFDTPEITIEGDIVSASVTMKNSTQEDQEYVIVIAAYDENGSLLKLVKGADSVLSANTQSEKSETVSMPVDPNAVTYKVLVWDSLNTIMPLAYAEK